MQASTWHGIGLLKAMAWALDKSRHDAALPARPAVTESNGLMEAAGKHGMERDGHIGQGPWHSVRMASEIGRNSPSCLHYMQAA